MQKIEAKKTVVSIMLGCAGFLGAFFSLTFSNPPFALSLHWSYALPLLAGMAYGGRYGVIAGTLGLGALFPFFLWATNGWANVVTSLLYILLYAWCGYFESVRRKHLAFWNHPLFITIPYIILYFVASWLLYPLAFSYNPPFWAPHALNAIPLPVLTGMLTKGCALMYLIIVMDVSLMNIPLIRTFLGLEVPKESRNNGTIIFFAVIGALCLWYVLCTFNHIFIYKTFPQELFSFSDPHEIISLIVFVAAGFSIGYILSLYMESRLRAEAELQESELRFRTVADCTYDWEYWLAPDQRILYMSPSCERITGYSAAEFLAQPELLAYILYPDDQAVYSDHIRQCLNENKAQAVDFRITRRDGQVRWIAHVCQAIYDETACWLGRRISNRDITDRKLAEEELRNYQEHLEYLVEERTAALRESEEQFRRMFEDHYAVMLLIEVETGKIIRANHSAIKYYGYPVDEFENMMIYQINLSDKKTVTEEMRKAVYKQKNCFHFSHRLANGEIRDVEVHSSPIPFKGKTILFSVIHDITERRLAQKEILKAKEAAEAATLAKSDFLANMSHEIRTPMNAVVNMTRMLLATDLDMEQKDYAETAMTASETLLSLIDDILDFSKIESGKLELEVTDFSLPDTVGSVVKVLGPKAGEKGLRLTHSIDPSVHPYLKGDSARVRQILLNFVSNAVKFTEKGGIEIRVFSENQTDTHVTLKFSVTDTGIGISERHIGKLFKSFSQADSSTTRKYGGTGLGLAISKQLAELIGGSVGVESGEGKGSVFWFTAKFEICKELEGFENLQALSSYGNKAHEGFQNLRRDIRILLAEDNIPNQKVALAILGRFGLSADVVSNGREAVEALRKTRYDLVLMDMQMPELDGTGATRIIRDPGSGVLNPDVPIIAMTANATREDRKKCADAGMNGYVSKPVSPDELLSAIRKQLLVGSEQLSVDSEQLSVSMGQVSGDSEQLSVSMVQVSDGSLITDNSSLSTDNSSLTTEIFDYEELLARVGENEELLKSLVRDFPRHLNEQIRELKSALNEKNSERIRLHSHTIKGMCANMAAKRLSDTAHQIEIAAKEGKTDAAEMLIKRLEDETFIFQSLIADKFPDMCEPSENSVADDDADENLTEEAKARLPELLHILENEIIPKWNKIRDIFYMDDVDAFATELEQIAEKYHTTILSNYSQKLHAAVIKCDIDKIHNIINEFLNIVDNIRN